MQYDLVRPCTECPFVQGGVTLSYDRREEIAYALNRTEFVCHKTNPGVGGNPPEKHCAGALIVCERQGSVSQMARIMERLGQYDASKLAMDDPRVPWEDLDDWVENAEEID